MEGNGLAMSNDKGVKISYHADKGLYEYKGQWFTSIDQALGYETGIEQDIKDALVRQQIIDQSGGGVVKLGVPSSRGTDYRDARHAITDLYKRQAAGDVKAKADVDALWGKLTNDNLQEKFSVSGCPKCMNSFGNDNVCIHCGYKLSEARKVWRSK